MKVGLFNAGVFIFILSSFMVAFDALAASVSPALLKAKQEAESKGYVFLTSHEEIVAKAKKERRLRALSSTPGIQHMANAFRKKYPFIDTYVEELEGPDSYQRFLLEMKAGGAKGWDATHIPPDLYNDYLLHQKKFDILGMSKHGVLEIPSQIIDPINRNVVAITSSIQVVAYNQKLIAPEKIPDSWEEFLRPEFKGRKFILDVRPEEIAALVPAWGLERTIDFARRLAAQQPIWVRGATRVLTSMAAGEYDLFIGPNYHTVRRAQSKSPAGGIEYKVLEPVPTRFTNLNAVLATADHPHAALLWLEFQVTPEGQKILDHYGPYQASVFVPESVTRKVVRGKNLSIVDWEHLVKAQEYQRKVLEAYGFPKAEIKR